MLGTFIQTYGYWILIGVVFIFMLRMHSGGMHAHGGGERNVRHEAHGARPTPPEAAESGERPAAPDAPRPTDSEAKR